ncbi:uncharacterized protein Z520_06184 [Fonsecaea multimorphosa CBS 102226]|uniref:Uncharacterized protein n=1 Tax=Fonsecaea multimorphosa CBS 102226 TaxID=1442371 RepID=A0A0D2K4K8_9EURO|nr:uncharacterized protein Z520_06184 [Fonsecaea multimorphosa CBS 102226]KIX98104.1 hypothetical protein Z520_06184 [Fonsecaea multimorphosa CBS 102226]
MSINAESRIEAVGTTKLVECKYPEFVYIDLELTDLPWLAVSEKEDGTGKDNSTVILIPTPTTNPNDPLNWPLWRKSWLSAVTLFWCFMINAS